MRQGAARGFRTHAVSGRAGTDPFRDLLSRNPDTPPISYNLSINIESTGRPYVASEVFFRPQWITGDKDPLPFMRSTGGHAAVWAGDNPSGPEDEATPVELTDTRQLAVAT